MDVHVNGEPRPLPPGATISTLLESLGLSRQACAVEVNKELVPKSKHPSRELAAGDRVEVVTLVGGG
ncbi:MAG: sulfur carrier protein ThiS [Phycisphaerales bacterium]